MARQVSEQAAQAFQNGYKFSQGATTVTVTDMAGIETVSLLLHGHTIAQRKGGVLYVTNCGYFTAVTKERLNAIHRVDIYQKAGTWYLLGQEWNGEWAAITNAPKAGVKPWEYLKA